jgi:hypothetical protein
VSPKRKTRRGDPSVVVGMVKFPNDQPGTGEGGLFVRLVVLDTARERSYMDRYVPCVGGYTAFMEDGLFIADDLHHERCEKDPEPPLGLGSAHERRHTSWRRRRTRLDVQMHRRYFPEEREGMSQDFLAIALMGATGWSSNSWAATYDDLTEQGKQLYRSLLDLYPGCELRLLTFLDT